MTSNIPSDFQKYYDEFMGSYQKSTSPNMTPDDINTLYQKYLGDIGSVTTDEKQMTKDDMTALYNQYLAQMGTPTETPTFGTREDFNALLADIKAGMGDDATLKANIEAALRPQYDRTLADLQKQRAMSNAQIDVDAASRGMGTSTWVTDAKLQNLRNAESARADLEANYASTLYGNLVDAIKNRDNDAYNQAMTWWNQQENQKLNQLNMIREDRTNAYNNAFNMMQYQNSLYQTALDRQRENEANAYARAWDWMQYQTSLEQAELARQRQAEADAYDRALQWWQYDQQQAAAAAASKGSGSKPLTQDEWMARYGTPTNNSGDLDIVVKPKAAAKQNKGKGTVIKGGSAGSPSYMALY